jgi:alpha-D-xyloside xylohydrolase
MLVRDGSVLPHVKLAQSTDKIDWSKITLKTYTADKKEATGLICLPTDGILQEIKMDCSKSKPQLLTKATGTTLQF